MRKATMPYLNPSPTRLERLARVGQEVVDAVLPLICSHDPQTLIGKPIGMYHCPDCAQMQIAGTPHVADMESLRDALANWQAAVEEMVQP